MDNLTGEERRRIRLAGQIARGLRYFLYLVAAGMLALLAIGLYIQFGGGQ